MTRLKSFYQKKLIEAGCDEAGRGSLAGPVYAAAVIIPKNFFHPKLNDSKKMKAAEREEVREYIIKNALAWSVASVDHEQIDRINILQASFLAMHLALEKLSCDPQFILVDGNRFLQFKKTPFKCIVKGDGKYKSIAAASVLAKTFRDEYMDGLHEKFPEFGWNKNKGYGSFIHRKAIQQFGRSVFHRKTFLLKHERNEQISLF